jgi:hypothetical protein
MPADVAFATIFNANGRKIRRVPALTKRQQSQLAAGISPSKIQKGIN